MILRDYFKMKTLLFLIILVPQMAFSQMTERSFMASSRTENNRAVIEEVTLTDLRSNESFEGEYFKVVEGKSDEPISFDADKSLVLKAATVYYHLTKARSYFVNVLKSEHVLGMPKMVIRIELRNQFFELGHFAHDNVEPQFNNALTIPAGTGLASRGVIPWGIEIWFRPQKKLHISEIKVNDLAGREFKSLMGQFRNQIHMQSLQSFFSQLIISFVNTEAGINPFSVENLVRTAGSSIIMESGYQFFDPINKLFSRKWYWLDTALVPEVIYHEYSHAALSDRLILSSSTAIIEGMADYFAGKIANSPTLAKNIKKYNTYNGKDAKRKQNYMIQFELGDYANTDFVFGLLWQLDESLNLKKDKNFIFELRKHLTTNAEIRGDLIDGLLKTCDAVCEHAFIEKLKIQKFLHSRGI